MACGVLGLASMRVGAQVTAETLLEAQYVATLSDARSPLNVPSKMRFPRWEVEARAFPLVVVRRHGLTLRSDTRLLQRWAATDSSAATVEVQELVVAKAIGRGWYLAMGRQRLGWGTGLVANPTRLEPQRDPQAVNNRLRGTTALRVEHATTLGLLQLVVAPARELGGALVAARIERTLGAAAGSVSMTTRSGRDWRLGADITVPLPDVTLYAEGTFSGWKGQPASTASMLSQSSSRGWQVGHYTDVVGGLLWLPTASLQSTFEYRFQSDHMSPRAFAEFVDALPLSADKYDPLGQGRHRIFGSVRFGSTQGAAATVGAFVDPLTKQLLALAGMEYTGRQVRGTLRGNWFNNRDALAPVRRRVTVTISVFL